MERQTRLGHQERLQWKPVYDQTCALLYSYFHYINTIIKEKSNHHPLEKTCINWV